MGLGLLAEMEHHSLQADTASYSAAISACEKGQRWEMAFALFVEMPLVLIAEMPAKWVDADIVSYNAAIRACEKGRQWMMASGLPAEIERTP